jgi:hypothetical protein
MARHHEEAEMNTSKSSEEMIPQADKQAHTEIAERAGRDGKQAANAGKDGEKTSSDEMIPQADKQAHTEIAERVGRSKRP